MLKKGIDKTLMVIKDSGEIHFKIIEVFSSHIKKDQLTLI